MSSELTTIEDNEVNLYGGGLMAGAPTSALAVQMAAAMIDKRIATARAFRRSITAFKREAMQLLSEDIETARSAEYSKPVGGGKVQGPSIRLAELAAMCWGNLDIEVAEPIVGDKSVTVMAYAWDLERNYRAPGTASTSLLDKQGVRMKAAVVENLVLATASKARRNAILAIIPKSYITDLLNHAKLVASKQFKTMEESRNDVMSYFARTHRIKPEQIFALLEVDGIDDIGQDQIDTIRGVATAIKEGSSLEEFFKPHAESKGDEVKRRIADQKAKATGSSTAIPAPTLPPTVPPPATTAALEPPPPPSKAPTKTTASSDKLLQLIAQLEQSGQLVAFLEQQSVTIEDLENSKTKQRSEYADAIARFLRSTNTDASKE